MNNYEILLGVFGIWNLIGFLLMGLDKFKARHDSWRIRENTFFVIAALGASIGVLAGMRFFRHKTLHRSFAIGIPVILILQAAFVLWIIFFKS